MTGKGPSQISEGRAFHPRGGGTSRHTSETKEIAVGMQQKTNGQAVMER